MIIGNYVSFFKSVPLALKHATPLAGLTIVDFGAPIFFFMIGISYVISLEKRLGRDGLWLTIGHFLLRYFLLWLFGLVGVFAVNFKLEFGWNVLMAIGCAGLCALPFIFLKPIWRFSGGMALLVIYQFVILKHFMKTILAYDMGGGWAAISWAGLILISSVWWPILKRGDTKIVIFSALGTIFLTGLFSFVLNPRYPANKPIASLSYILLSYGVAVFALLFFYLTDARAKLKWGIFRIFGRNALFIYMFSSVLILIVQRMQKPDLGLPYVILCGLAIYSICLLIASYLDHKKLNIKV